MCFVSQGTLTALDEHLSKLLEDDAKINNKSAQRAAELLERLLEL